MTTKTDGGPAFPANLAETSGGIIDSLDIGQGGMTIRDYFAAKFAVAWVLSITSTCPTESREAIGIEANRLGLLQATHMLAQRDKS